MDGDEPMRLLVCGGRDYTDDARLRGVLDKIYQEKALACVIEGGARGADRLAQRWAKDMSVALLTFPAKWGLYGKRAGYLRNEQMLVEGKPTHVIAFPGGRGTADMVRQAKKAGIPTWEIPAPPTLQERRDDEHG